MVVSTLKIGNLTAGRRIACFALLNAFLLQISGASAAVVAQAASAEASDSPPGKTQAARPVSAHWSLPFDGRLSGDAPEEHHTRSVTVLHLDQPAARETDSQAGQPELPSAVTLTPPPVAQAAKSPVERQSNATTSGTGTSVQTAKQTTSKDSERQSPAAAGQDNQLVKLRPPIGGQLNPSSPETSPASKKIITGEVSTWQGPINVDRIINSLVDKNFTTSSEARKLDKQLKHLSSPTQKAISVTKDSFNDALGYQGFDPSARAGKLILDDNYKVRDRAWAEYERQKYVDKIHLQVVSGMMQIAEALGMTDTARAAQVLATGQDSLDSLVGKDEAGRTVQGLKTWLNHVTPANSSFSQTPWNTIERNKKLEAVLKEALKQDPLVAEITQKVERYAHPGKLKAGSSRVVETTLNAISILGPGFAIPVGAEVLDTAFKQSTGGSEEHKLERELLLDKRIQSRLKVLSQEAALALDNYRFALVTKNPTLLVFSEEIIGNMTGRSNLPKIVSADPSALASPQIAPEIKESQTQNKKPPISRLAKEALELGGF
jgi:hypothetical protein